MWSEWRFCGGACVSPSEADSATEKCGGKRGTIYLCGAWSFEIILTLLTKVVAIHVRFSGIGLRDSSLKWPLLWLCRGLGLGCLYEHLHESGEEILSGERNKRWNRSLWKGKSLRRSLIAFGVGSFCWALSTGKLVQISSEIDRSIDTRVPASTKSWSHCEGLIVMLFFQMG